MTDTGSSQEQVCREAAAGSFISGRNNQDNMQRGPGETDECGLFLNSVREPDAQRPPGCTDPPAPRLSLWQLVQIQISAVSFFM